MKAELLAIATRIKELREILEIPIREMSEGLAVSECEYKRYESGESDIPISVLWNIAERLGVDATLLLTGDAPRMTRYSVTRAGSGAMVERYPGYNYQSLSYNFCDRSMDPLLVTLEEGETAALVTHSGQEFNYVIEGMIKITIGDKQFILNQGDCIYFDPTVPHGQSSVKGRSVFLTVINE